MMFDDLTHARAIMADREREASRARLGRVARRARAAAACCETQLAGPSRLVAGGRRTAPATTCSAC